MPLLKSPRKRPQQHFYSVVRSPEQDPYNADRKRTRRIHTLLGIALILLVLGGRFFYVQILRQDFYTKQADDNRFTTHTIAAPRGTIYDRNGQVLANTVVEYDLLLEPGPTDSLRARLEWALRQIPDLHRDSLLPTALNLAARKNLDEPVPVRRGIAFAQVSWIEEHRRDLPGIMVQPRAIRRYPPGPAIAHLVGYVGQISPRELADSVWADYTQGRVIGKSGIERRYERRLGGRPGTRYLEVDARGRTVGGFREQLTVEPTPGEDLRLTIDLPLQRFVHETWPQGRRGAVVAMVPSTGEVLAMYSSPTYDPNGLLPGASPSLWSQVGTLQGRPLLNRATQGLYAPASTWKLATALIGLERGVIEPKTRMPIPCTGGMQYAGRYSRCWQRAGHGSVDLIGAIQHSCNVYFYQIGMRLTLTTLMREGTRLGFARRTGIDLPSERQGVFPRDGAWWRKQFGEPPVPSDVMSLAIGQGPNDQTPLRMAQFFSALAGDGTAPTPRLVADAPRRAMETDLRVQGASLEAVREGMARVTAPGGTAATSALARWKLAGKTGTAQNSQDRRRPHAWFAGFAGPRGATPEIAIAVLLEHGESGSEAAAPIASRVAGFYLDRKAARR